MDKAEQRSQLQSRHVIRPIVVDGVLTCAIDGIRVIRYPGGLRGALMTKAPDRLVHDKAAMAAVTL